MVRIHISNDSSGRIVISFPNNFLLVVKTNTINGRRWHSTALIDADIETVSLSSNPKFIALIERSRLKQKAEGGFSTEEMRQRLEKPKRSAHVR